MTFSDYLKFILTWLLTLFVLIHNHNPQQHSTVRQLAFCYYKTHIVLQLCSIKYLLGVMLGLWYVVLGKWQRKVIDVITEAWLWLIGKRTLSVSSPARDQLTAANCMLWFNQLICGVMVKPHNSWRKWLPILLRSQEIKAERYNTGQQA